MIEIIMFALILVIIFLIIKIVLDMEKLRLLKKEINQIKSSQRSTYVKHGQAWEHFVPFMENFPGEKQNFRFIGKPIDGICFDEDKIRFIEIKTGSSNLNSTQRRIKKQIKEGKIEWHELRY